MRPKKKLVILSPYPSGGAPSQRFRFEQYISYLSEKYLVSQFSFWSVKTNNALYSKGRTYIKLLGAIIGVFNRFIHLYHSISADTILIHREVAPIGPPILEWTLSKVFRKKIVFDFDDAIWLANVSEQNKNHEWVKNYNKTKRIISLSSLVIVGNDYLKTYALNYNKNVVVIPTTIDTDYHIPSNNYEKNKICIGWTGSKSTVKYFIPLIPVFQQLKEKYQDKIYFKLIGDESFKEPSINLKGTAWNLVTEIEDLQEIDIGVMPLPNDNWAKGKCGFKGLQYMALKIPAILSPVGVNSEIIQDAENGFLASTTEEWVEKLSALIESQSLRKQIGEAGLKTVKEKYSVEANKQKYLECFNQLTTD